MSLSPPRPGAPPPELGEPLERAADRLGVFARRVLWYPELGSTNDLAMTLADAGEPEGCVVVADAQSAGRGRLGRIWVSPPGTGIYASVVLRPSPAAAPLMTLAAGVAVAEGIEAATGLRLQLKWPNDVVIGDGGAQRRKVAGILAESRSPSSVVLGLGINVLTAVYPPDIASKATSIEAELGRAADRGVVLAECIVALAKQYGDLQASRVDAVVSAWRARAALTFGRSVEWDAGGTIRQGVAQDIDSDGALLVRAHGSVVRVISGEVRWT
jgi:BirA family biotin operon repressor/biotin-[acetyl-CoA-carboxylase] ligase